MTTFAMIAGMVPVAFGAEQLAPLGRAVIGGLAASTVATLFILPPLFALVQARARAVSPSLDPDDAASRFYIPRPGDRTADGEGRQTGDRS
jgi:hypothetical protein